MNRREVLIGTALGLIGADPAWALIQAADVSGPGTTNTTRPRTPEQEKLERVVAECFPSLGSPGFWCAIALRGQIVASIATGVRKAGTNDAANVSDKVIWGSISKAVAGTLAGALVQAGVLSYGTRVREVFPEWAHLSSQTLDATVAHLLTHTAGIPNGTGYNLPDPGEGKAWRLRHAEELVRAQPIAPLRNEFHYAAGVDLVVAMAERKTNKRYEDLLRDYVLRPFGLTRCGLGWPGEEGPWGHVREPNGSWKASLFAHHSARYSPAGCMHGSILDLARFGATHAEAWQRGVSTISKETFRRMHQHLSDPVKLDQKESATTLSGLGGWPEGNLNHDGMWYRGDYAFVECSPRRRTCVALYRNSHDSPGKADFRDVLERLSREIPILHYGYQGPV